MAITETWLRKNEHPSSLFPCARDYFVYRSDREEGTGGGVALLVSKKYKCQEVSSSAVDGGELIWILLEKGSKRSNEKLLVCCFYRSNVSKLAPMQKLFEDIQTFEQLNIPMLLLGDFNMPDIDWSIPFSPGLHGQDELLNVLVQHGFTQYVDMPTRGLNTLDLVLCNTQGKIHELKTHNPLASSDHNVISFKYLINFQRNPNVSRNWEKGFYFGIERGLENVCWEEVFQETQNVDQMYVKFLNIFNNLVELFVPFSNSRARRTRYSKNSRKLLHKRRKVMRRLKVKFSLTDKHRFNTLNVEFSNSLRKDAEKRESLILRNPNPKKFFKYVNAKTKSNDGIPALCNPDGSLALSDQSKANLLNDTFASNFSTDDGKTPSFVGPKQGCSMPDVLITRQMVADTLRSFPANTSSGPDGIPALALKKLANQLAVPFQYIFLKV